MKNLKNWLLLMLFSLVSTVAFSQTKITGTVTDGELKGSLPGASVIVKGTSEGTTTDFDGKFTLTTNAKSGELVISFVGYISKTVSFKGEAGKTITIGNIILQSDSNTLEDVVVKVGVADIAKDRKTPVAVSTIKAAEIQEKLGNREFPEMLNNTPSVYATKSGGGFGDSRITIRGFDQKNIAVMVNGTPINDMENSAVYWSNWAGIADVTSTMQVQRGLGSSKLAISSVGGTINILTRPSDMKEGGSVSTMVGNNNNLKLMASYSTGKMKNGFSSSVLFSRNTGNGYVDGTKYEGYNYFIGFGYELNDKHDFQFTFTGAPQWHDQRSTAPTVAEYIQYGADGEPNVKYNSDWGYLNGKQYSFRTNYYHKPVAMLNWDWKISDKMKLSSVFYGSWGRGGGSTTVGSIQGVNYNDARLRNADGSIDVNRIYAYNSGQTIYMNGSTTPYTRAMANGRYENTSATGNVASNGISKISSINSHNWYGSIIKLNTKFTETLSVDFGVDLRTYKGIHYQVLNDLLGGTVFNNRTSDVNNPNAIVTSLYNTKPNGNPFLDTSYQNTINYNNDGDVNWYGAFAQVEYNVDNFSAFVQGAISNQGFKRVDYFKYLSSDPLSATPYENILGGNVKAGANYNINENHNVFVNAGYYSKQPFFNAVYPNNASIVNPLLTNEKITGFEAGYGFRSSIVNANVNVYHTTWKDRFQRANDANPSNPGGYLDYSGMTEVHMGAELDVVVKATDRLRFNGMFSYGDWFYKGNVTSNNYDSSNNPVGTSNQTLYLDKVKVGDAAQLTASAGATFEVVERLKLDGNFRYVDKLYAAIDPVVFKDENNKGSLQLPSYNLVDVGMSYKMLVGKNKSNAVNFRVNVDNLLDRTYIAESRTNIHATDKTGTAATAPTYLDAGRTYKGIADANRVYFGFGRTWNVSIRYDF
ncbi:TonB-dependent receptor [Flavobacterium sp.]|uniref:TonB-dependent receptor n=1 Tax=Flavobacterium sp. TaxID=239 RepID=UPI002628D71D|nr:TonB-dependent receptor [Flavobacterium sp.]